MKTSLSLTVSEIFNGECDAMVDMTLNDLKQRLRSFILVSVDFSYTTSCRLSIVTFALDAPFLAVIHNVTDYRRETTTATDAALYIISATIGC